MANIKEVFIAALIAVLLLSIPVFVYAIELCGDYEYSELKDMDKETLLKKYGDIRHAISIYADLYIASGYRDKKAERDIMACGAVGEKMERAYKSNFKRDLGECGKTCVAMKKRGELKGNIGECIVSRCREDLENIAKKEGDASNDIDKLKKENEQIKAENADLKKQLESMKSERNR